MAIIVAVVVAAAILAVFVYGFRGRPNEPPALGNNAPWPEGFMPMPGSETPIETQPSHPERHAHRPSRPR